MRTSATPRIPTRGLPPRRPRRTHYPARAAWQRPTFSEFVARVESEFGSPRGAGPPTGLAPSDRLSPETLRDLCRSWGLPPEDFGVDAD